MNTNKFDLINTVFNYLFYVIFIIVIVRAITSKKKGGTGGSGMAQIMEAIAKATRGQQNKQTPGSTTDAAKPQTVVSLPIAGPDQSVTPLVGVNQLKTLLYGISLPVPPPPVKLNKRQRYLQIALNSTLDEARSIISQLPKSERILVEAGTPLIKMYGAEAIRAVKAAAWPGAYIVADTKTTDLAEREVVMAAQAGAHAITCLGVAPVETIDRFISACQENGVDSMIDMMNVDRANLVLKKLKQLPDVVILHRGVDESEFSREKQIPFYQIKQIKGSCNILVSVAGGDDIREVQRAVFNDADIVVVWKDFYRSTIETAKLASQFLYEVK
jgi:3-keto-L-gulonate-6-phosphate decarboxylase